MNWDKYAVPPKGKSKYAVRRRDKRSDTEERRSDNAAEKDAFFKMIERLFLEQKDRYSGRTLRQILDVSDDQPLLNNIQVTNIYNACAKEATRQNNLTIRSQKNASGLARDAIQVLCNHAGIGVFSNADSDAIMKQIIELLDPDKAAAYHDLVRTASLFNLALRPGPDGNDMFPIGEDENDIAVMGSIQSSLGAGVNIESFWSTVEVMEIIQLFGRKVGDKDSTDFGSRRFLAVDAFLKNVIKQLRTGSLRLRRFHVREEGEKDPYESVVHFARTVSGNSEIKEAIEHGDQPIRNFDVGYHPVRVISLDDMGNAQKNLVHPTGTQENQAGSDRTADTVGDCPNEDLAVSANDEEDRLGKTDDCSISESVEGLDPDRHSDVPPLDDDSNEDSSAGNSVKGIPATSVPNGMTSEGIHVRYEREWTKGFNKINSLLDWSPEWKEEGKLLLFTYLWEKKNFDLGTAGDVQKYIRGEADDRLYSNLAGGIKTLRPEERAKARQTLSGGELALFDELLKSNPQVSDQRKRALKSAANSLAEKLLGVGGTNAADSLIPRFDIVDVEARGRELVGNCWDQKYTCSNKAVLRKPARGSEPMKSFLTLLNLFAEDALDEDWPDADYEDNLTDRLQDWSVSIDEKLKWNVMPLFAYIVEDKFWGRVLGDTFWQKTARPHLAAAEKRRVAEVRSGTKWTIAQWQGLVMDPGISTPQNAAKLAQRRRQGMRGVLSDVFPKYEDSVGNLAKWQARKLELAGMKSIANWELHACFEYLSRKFRKVHEWYPETTGNDAQALERGSVFESRFISSPLDIRWPDGGSERLRKVVRDVLDFHIKFREYQAEEIVIEVLLEDYKNDQFLREEQFRSVTLWVRLRRLAMEIAALSEARNRIIVRKPAILRPIADEAAVLEAPFWADLSNRFAITNLDVNSMEWTTEWREPVIDNLLYVIGKGKVVGKDKKLRESIGKCLQKDYPLLREV